MGNIALTVDKQIERLQQRGMELDCGIDKAKEILLDIGYYRLGLYWHSFEIDCNHNFKKGTKLSDVVSLYYLDVDLKTILTKALNRIEINFRTQVVYKVSNKYPEYPTWFVNNRVMQSDFITGFSKKYYTDDFKRNNTLIKNHHIKYPNDIYAPAWKTLEFLSFGGVNKVFYNLKDE
jgi:abortive infection bacteriophage resistance protein